MNSGRWLQWHWQGGDAAGRGASSDVEIMAQLFNSACEALYPKEGGTFPDPILNLSWHVPIPTSPSPEELAKEFNGYGARGSCRIRRTRRSSRCKAGEQLPGFALLHDDGTTACGCWIFSGCFTEAGNQMARRDNADPSGLGSTLNWAWSWPANRRILYNRASADARRQAVGSDAQAASRGTARTGPAPTFPTIKRRRATPDAGCGRSS